MPFAVARDGTRLYFEECGAGEPLLLVHGNATNHRGWGSVPSDFAAEYRVISFDHRGLGQSDKPEDPVWYSTRNFARDAVAILNHLEIPRAHAYGVSMGASVCVWLDSDAPERVGSLVLGCSNPAQSHGVKREPWVDAAMQNPDVASRERALDEALFSPKWIETHRAEVDGINEAIRPPSAIIQQLHARSGIACPAWDVLPTLSASTLLIHGTDDPMAPAANVPIVAERIPNAEVYMVKSGRHGYFLEFREEASRVVLSFLKRHPLAVSPVSSGAENRDALAGHELSA